MFCKLALGNVRRSFRDYGVYLLTLTFGVCLFYTFNSVEDQGAILYLQEKNGETVRAILTVLGVLSVFVAVVLACLILYAHRFLLRRRKKELGCYLLLGMSPGQVSRLLILETAVTGLISLIAGLVLGSAASSGLSALTLSLFQMDVSAQLGLVFSPGAAVKTAVCFGAILLLVMALSGVEVTRARLIDLLRGDRKNEVLPLRPLSASVFQFVAGVVCLLAAYGILLYFGLVTALVVLPLCAAMLILGTAGTLLLFRSLPGFVLHGVKRHPALYYRGLNLFTLRQWLSRVHSTYLSQTVIAILLLLAMGITASSVGLNSTIQALTDDQAPFDLTVQNRSADESGPVDFDAAIKAGGAERALAWSYDCLLYYNDPAVTGLEQASGAIALRDYNALLEHLGRPAYSGPLPHLLVWEEDVPATGGLGMQCILVEDEVAQRLEVRRQLWSADYAGDKQASEDTVLPLVSDAMQGLDGPDVRIDSRLALYQETMGSKILVLFLGLYLGFTFLLAAAAVLALQQLSQGADNARRYALLGRLGVEEKALARSAAHQVTLAFLLPLGLGLVHAAVGLSAVNQVITVTGNLDSSSGSLSAAALLLAVYGGYYLATLLSCRRMALSAAHRQRQE